MFVLNFAHPLGEQHEKELEVLTGLEIEEVVNINSQVDLTKPLAPQVRAMVDACGIHADAWPHTPIVVNAPSLAVSAALVMAEIHRRAGRFPLVMRMIREGDLFPTWKVEEVIDPNDEEATA